MRPSRTIRSAGLLLGTQLLLAGCQPTCEQVCDKLVACDNPGTERMSSPECEESCTTQKETYARWSDTQLRATMDDQLSCLDEATCGAIADGACYDEDLWGF